MHNQPTLDFADLSDDEQRALLDLVAPVAARAFGLEPVAEGVELVELGYNATYAITTASGDRYALRVLVNSASDDPAVAAQVAWTLAIAADTDVLVPVPTPAPNGRYLLEVSIPEWPLPWRAVLNSWLEGTDAGHELTREQAACLGSAMATLHNHAEQIELPAGLPIFDEPLLGDDNALKDFSTGSAEDDALIAAAFARCQHAFDRLYQDARLIPLHADLHGYNLKWNPAAQGARQLAVFDFDDSGLGIPALDLAITTFYLRDLDAEVEQALRAAYANRRPLPKIAADDFEALVASRQLLMLNLLLTASTAEFRDQADNYLAKTLRRLRHWQDTGHFALLD